MSNEMRAQDAYIRLEKNGKSIINHHRVWDLDRFFASQVEQHSGKNVNPEDRSKVSLATREDYQGARK